MSKKLNISTHEIAHYIVDPRLLIYACAQEETENHQEQSPLDVEARKKVNIRKTKGLLLHLIKQNKLCISPNSIKAFRIIKNKYKVAGKLSKTNESTANRIEQIIEQHINNEYNEYVARKTNMLTTFIKNWVKQEIISSERKEGNKLDNPDFNNTNHIVEQIIEEGHILENNEFSPYTEEEEAILDKATLATFKLATTPENEMSDMQEDQIYDIISQAKTIEAKHHINRNLWGLGESIVIAAEFKNISVLTASNEIKPVMRKCNKFFINKTPSITIVDQEGIKQFSKRYLGDKEFDSQINK